MWELKNNTPFATSYALLPNIQGVDTLYVNVRATFNLGRAWTLADEQTPPLSEDVYWGEPGQSSLRYPTSLHSGKPSTDIAIHASASAPDNKPVRVLDVSASIGSIHKTLRVFGDRFWHKGRISEAAQFVRMPLRYERAFGGQYWRNDQLVSLEQRNPIGSGFCGPRKAEEMDGEALPNIEDPRQLINRVDETPPPAGFGFIAPNWQPRALHAGTFDEQWQTARAPYLPFDYSPLFQNAASPDLISPQYLTGGEPVLLTNLHAAGPIEFVVPHVLLSGKVQFSGQPTQSLFFLLETLTIDIDNGRLLMDWKAPCICNNAFPRIRAVSISLVR